MCLVSLKRVKNMDHYVLLPTCKCMKIVVCHIYAACRLLSPAEHTNAPVILSTSNFSWNPRRMFPDYAFSMQYVIQKPSRTFATPFWHCIFLPCLWLKKPTTCTTEGTSFLFCAHNVLSYSLHIFLSTFFQVLSKEETTFHSHTN